ncbi:lytic polysaccharide monooxygenase [Arsenophonus nasoniae]|uniref:lytic polysaccharide monooxygenase n=3 Tax=Arsenophonus nasoniae TaxID=638 RepID=UPI0038797716
MKLKKIFIMSIILTASSTLWAHGYIKSPASRAYKCAQGINKDCGDIKYEPQSVEQRSGFPDKNFPIDGKLASGGIQRFAKLDEAGENRWHKTQMHVGDNNFSWYLTARHSTANWRYYITKNGWNPNVPLTRAAFDLKPFCTQYDGGAIPKADVSIICEVPVDRIGYHIIYGVWQIADTSNSFYQVVDVIFPDNDKKQPTEPDIKEPTETVTNQPDEPVVTDTTVTGTKPATGSVVTQPTETATNQPGEPVITDKKVTSQPTETVTTLITSSNTTLNTGSNTTLNTGSNTTLNTGSNTTLNTGSNTTLSTGSNTTLITSSNTTLNTGSNTTLNIGSKTTLNTGSNTTLSTGSNTTLSTGSSTTLSTGSSTTLSTGSNTTLSKGSNTLLNSVANTIPTVASATATDSALTFDDNETDILPRYFM